jgi:Ca2+-binding EF-hand superfamily protein
VTAYVFRFIRWIKGQTVDKTLELSADELIEGEAEQMWIKDIQNNMFPEEVKQLINGTKTSAQGLINYAYFWTKKE